MSRGVWRAAALIALGLVVFLTTWYVVVLASDRQTTVGAHDATVRVEFDGHVTILSGPLLPELRIATHAPLGLGAQITLRDSATRDLHQMLARDGVIASQPAGEIARLTSVVRSILLAAAVIAGACAIGSMILAVAVWKLVGPGRRRELVDGGPPSARVAIGTAVLSAAVLVTAFMTVPQIAPTRAQSWVPIRSEFPLLDDLPRTKDLRHVEVSQGAAASGVSTLIKSGLEVYHDSVKFYDRLKKRAKKTSGLHVPTAGQSVALVVTDRHDNIAMDPIAKVIGVKGDASLLIDLGDDTSGGDRWEDFSQQSLRSNFKGWPVYWVAGNHDHGPVTTKLAKKLGFEVMDGTVREYDGVRMLGQADPRSTGLISGWGASQADNSRWIQEQSARLADTACADSAGVSLMITHSIRSAADTVDRGCVDLAIAGHLHRQVGPSVNDRDTMSLTIGSTGGAVAGFALGSALRREAQVALLTFAKGRVVGLQIVTFTPGAKVRVGAYTPVPGHR